jgi:hypothetical protein
MRKKWQTNESQVTDIDKWLKNGIADCHRMMKNDEKLAFNRIKSKQMKKQTK